MVKWKEREGTLPAVAGGAQTTLAGGEECGPLSVIVPVFRQKGFLGALETGEGVASGGFIGIQLKHVCWCVVSHGAG